MGACLATLLTACAAPPAVDTGAAAAASTLPALSLRDGEQALRVDATRSEILVLVHRAGRLARLGHNHVIAARVVTGGAALAGTVVGSRLRLSVPLVGLTVDEPALRARLGEAFASRPGEADIDATRANMLGTDGLHAGAFPSVEIAGEVRTVGGDGVRMALEVLAHGRVVRVGTTAELVADDDAVRLRGRLVVAQSAFGITPFSVLGGALQVRDEVEVVFDVVARCEHAGCAREAAALRRAS